MVPESRGSSCEPLTKQAGGFGDTLERDRGDCTGHRCLVHGARPPHSYACHYHDSTQSLSLARSGDPVLLHPVRSVAVDILGPSTRSGRCPDAVARAIVTYGVHRGQDTESAMERLG